MYDDDDEGEIGLDAAAEAYVKRGTEDRAFVDQQAKEYDEVKRKKREEITHLKNLRLEAQSKLAHKQRELASLELLIRKDAYLETRERIRDEREVAMRADAPTREESADLEVEAIATAADRAEREQKKRELESECAVLKVSADEVARKISLLEYELARS